MNLKKVPTLHADRSTDPKALDEYVKKYPEFISSQIKIIQPDVVVCCGDITYSLLEQAISFKSNEFRKTIFLRTCHPTARSWRNNKGIVYRKKADGYKELLEEYRTYL